MKRLLLGPPYLFFRVCAFRTFVYARDARGRGGRPSFHLVTHTLEKKEEEEGPKKNRAISQMPKDMKIGEGEKSESGKAGEE